MFVVCLNWLIQSFVVGLSLGESSLINSLMYAFANFAIHIIAIFFATSLTRAE